MHFYTRGLNFAVTSINALISCVQKWSFNKKKHIFIGYSFFIFNDSRPTKTERF